MNTEVYIRESECGITRRLGAEVVDQWEGGRRIRSESLLELQPYIRYYIVEDGRLVGIELGQPSGEGPFEYSVELDPSDTRRMPDFEVQAT